MEANIIVGSSDADQLIELMSGAKEIAKRLKPQRAVTIRLAASVDDVQRKLNSDTLLLIVTASLPQSRSSTANDQQPALDFISSLQSKLQSPPCILVSDRPEHFRVAQRMKKCELLFIDSSTDYLEDCVQLARMLGTIVDAADPAPPGYNDSQVISAVVPPRAPAERTESSKFALVDVDLPADLRFATVRLEVHEGADVQRNDPVPLRLNEKKVGLLVKECKNLPEKLPNRQTESEQYYRKWKVEYSKLGKRFGNLLWSTQSFTDIYNMGLGAANGNVRVRFNLEQPWFDGLWEATIPSRRGQRFLMLDNTVARRARQENIGSYSRDTGGFTTPMGTLRVLVINSNVDDESIPENSADPLWEKHWTRCGDRLARLGHLEDEVNVLRALSGLNKVKTDVSQLDVKVDVLPAVSHLPDEEWSLADEVRTKLQAAVHGYDIVHFAGHALFTEGPKGGGQGHLVFAGYPRPRAVSVAEIATWLADAKVQLVYLSCCRSSAALAALEFARNKIPMVIGFQWDIDDAKAPRFASEFYQELLRSHLKVCRAVSRARLNLFNSSGGSDPIWASPVLIAQPVDWVQAEAVLRSTESTSHHGRRAA